MKTTLALVFSIVLITSMLLPPSASSQAAVSYGAAASNSTAMGAKASSSMRRMGSVNTRQLVRKGSIKIPGPPSKSLETVMEENRAKFAVESQSGGGVVEVQSKPEKATVSVDGNPVGFAPMEVKLPAGKHVIELTHPGCDPWYMEVAVNAQESTSVTAQLERKYKSSVTISFD